MASSAIAFLKDEKLRRLAQLIRTQEVNNLHSITFQSIGEQLQYLRMCNDNMASVNTILDECEMVSTKYKGDSVRSPIADLILVYVEHCLNNSLQIIRNYTMRRSYLDKLLDHVQQLLESVEAASSQDSAADLMDSVQEFDRMVMGYMHLSLNSHASAEYSRYLRNRGITYSDLVRTHQTRLGYTGQFEKLEEEEKLDVYVAIIEASGRLGALARKEGDVVEASSISYVSTRKKPKFGSVAMFLIDVGQVVWDVYSSDHPITTATREAFVLAAEMGGATIGKLVGVAAATKLTGVAATSIFVTAVGLATGFVGGFILGALAGVLFDLIISSGGERPLPTDGFVVYVAPMPDGRQLARRIA